MSALLVQPSRSAEDTVSLSAPLLKAARATIGVVGISSLLYAIGFAAIRAHYWGLGISPGSLEPQEITEEGGRFFYHLLYLPSTLFAHIGWLEVAILLIAPAAVVALAPYIRRRFLSDRPSHIGSGARTTVLRTIAVAMTIIVSAILVETVWSALRIQDLLYTRDTEIATFRSEANRTALYSAVLWRLAIVTSIALLLWFKAWLPSGVVERILIFTQWLITAAALGAWPMVYGKLLISDLRPVITDPAKPSQDHKLLVRKDGKSYLVWSKTQQSLEIWSLGENYNLRIGPKEHLLE